MNTLNDDDGRDYEEIAWLWMTENGDAGARENFAKYSLKQLADECVLNWQNDEPLDRDKLIHALAVLRANLGARI